MEVDSCTNEKQKLCPSPRITAGEREGACESFILYVCLSVLVFACVCVCVCALVNV